MILAFIMFCLIIGAIAFVCLTTWCMCNFTEAITMVIFLILVIIAIKLLIKLIKAIVKWVKKEINK